MEEGGGGLAASECMNKAILKNFAIFTGNLQGCNFIKNTLQRRCFPLHIGKFLRTPISKNTCAAQCTAGSVLTLLLSSCNLLTGYEQ